MFVPQPRSSRHNIHCERVMPDDVKPYSTEPCQAEEAYQIPETPEAVGTSVQLRKIVEEVKMFTDSDWAGCKETRKSSSAGVVMPGAHALKAYTRKQKIIARSSAEAELYAAALGASELN